MNIKSYFLLCLGFVFLNSCTTAMEPQVVRFATFNVAMGLQNDGELYQRLDQGNDPGLARVAEILQRVRPDVILFNEFDYEPGSEDLLRSNYLEISWSGQDPIEYPYAFLAPVNTGIDSGLDINSNGQTGDPQDAWGFGTFPGQYGMLVLSRYPIAESEFRSFRNFLWQDMPGALRPVMQNGESYYPEAIWQQLKLSSKSHWDLPVDIRGTTVHFLVSHPTPTVFDGPEDHNGRRNHDENRIWADYVQSGAGRYLIDDAGAAGGLRPGSAFVIAGDLNADPVDGGWITDSMVQLLQHHEIDASCIPQSTGGAEASEEQAGINLQQRGDPARDTSDFNDDYAGNLRIDYVLPSQGLTIHGCGVYWPARGEAGHELAGVSDHRLVWLDIEL